MTHALKRNQLEILRCWSLSTAHISSTDAATLSVCPMLVVYEYEHGFWVCVPEADELEGDTGEDFLMRLQKDCGLSPSVGHILTVARAKRIDWLKLDGDGPIYDFLPLYHW